MSGRTIPGVIMAILLAAGASAQGIAQTRDSALARARRLAADGEMAQARQLVDSLLTTTPPDSTGTDELLFTRASFAEDIQRADSDYRRIISAFPSSPRREESLLRLAQQSLIAADVADARKYLQQIATEYRADSAQARASYWLAKTFIESSDSSSACAANARALGLLNAADPALRAQIESQAVASCANAAGAGRPVAPAKKPRPPIVTTTLTTETESPVRGTRRYSVQLAAFPQKSDADQLAAKLRKSGLDARVDGTTKPFRVWVGRYATYAEAAREQRALRAKKLTGFVTEAK